MNREALGRAYKSAMQLCEKGARGENMEPETFAALASTIGAMYGALTAERDAAEARAEKAEAELARLREALGNARDAVIAIRLGKAGFDLPSLERGLTNALTPPGDPAAPGSTQER